MLATGTSSAQKHIHKAVSCQDEIDEACHSKMDREMPQVLGGGRSRGQCMYIAVVIITQTNELHILSSLCFCHVFMTREKQRLMRAS